MVGADADPALVGGHVVDTVRDGLAQLGVEEVVDLDRDRVPDPGVLPAGVLERPDELLLLSIDADHRLPSAGERRDLTCQVTELSVAVGMPGALEGLRVGLQAKPHPGQQLGHGAVRDRVPGRGQLRGQAPGRLARPAQRRHRFPSGIRLQQRLQHGRQPRIGHRQRPPPAHRAEGSGSPAISRTPRAIVSGCTPVAADTAAIPPRPS